jgi:ABC-2 type transport system ATP-binding protein
MTAGSPVGTGGAVGERTPVIRTHQLTKRYGDVLAVDHLDLEVLRGEVFGLLGPNGAGKTTTILMLLGLSEPTSGEARVVGLDPQRRPLDVKRRVGYLPDNAGFYGNLTGRENLRYTARLNGLRGRDAEDRIDRTLDQVGLVDVADRRADAYSRGMRQRLGIGDALVKDPDILILDEPTIAIDPIGVAEILGLIRRLVDERGIAVLLSSHLLGQVQSVCDRVGIFVSGRLVAQGRVADLARTAGGSTHTLEVGATDAAGHIVDGSRLDAVLRAIPGVRSVDTDPVDSGRSVVRSDDDIRSSLPGALERGGFSLAYLRRLEEDLSAVYERYIAEAAVAATEEAGRSAKAARLADAPPTAMATRTGTLVGTRGQRVSADLPPVSGRRSGHVRTRGEGDPAPPDAAGPTPETATTEGEAGDGRSE